MDILIFVYRPDPRPDFQDGLFLLEILLKVNMYSGCPSVINNGLMIQYGKGKTGKLANGKSVTVRPGSSEGSPTLQIPEGSSRQIEIRYKK